MDIRTPIKTSKGKLLGFDGVLLDVTRQAIAEHSYQTPCGEKV